MSVPLLGLCYKTVAKECAKCRGINRWLRDVARTIEWTNLNMVIAFPVPAEMVAHFFRAGWMVIQRFAEMVIQMQWQLNLLVLVRQCDRWSSMALRQRDDQMSMEI